MIICLFSETAQFKFFKSSNIRRNFSDNIYNFMILIMIRVYLGATVAVSAGTGRRVVSTSACRTCHDVFASSATVFISIGDYSTASHTNRRHSDGT